MEESLQQQLLQTQYQNIYLQNLYQEKAPTINIVHDTVDKILARTHSEIHIQNIFSQANHYAQDVVLTNAMSEILCKSNLPMHDCEYDINRESMDCEEPQPSELDVYATFHLCVKKTTIISKFNQRDSTTPIGEHTKITPTYKGPGSVYSMNMKLQQKSMKHLNDKGEDILPKPLLNTRGQEEDRLILNYRKKKEKEEKLKEEEKLKQIALEQRFKDLDDKGNAKDDKNMKKRLITYDSKGEVIFIKNLRADALPNPLLNPPYKIKLQKQPQNRTESQQSDYVKTQIVGLDESSARIIKRPQKGDKVMLLSQIDTPQIKNEIHPMGSVFNETEPGEGIKIGEGGKFKYGSMNLSKRTQGQMSLDEYRIQKDQVILQSEMLETQRSFNKTGKFDSQIRIDEQLTTDLDQTKEQNSNNIEIQKPFDLKLKQMQQNPSLPILSLENLNQSQMGNTFRMTYSKLDLSENRGNFKNQSALQTSRLSQDKVIRKKDGIEKLLGDNQRKSIGNILDQDTLEQSSYIDTLKSQRKVQFSTTQIFDIKQYGQQSQIIQARHSSAQKINDLEYSTRSTKALPPLLSNRKAMEQTSELLEMLRNKNNEIMMNNNWGQNPSDTNKLPRKIERKPKVLELKKSNSQIHLSTTRKKERNYIESVKQRQHLPPPPLGKTQGHGISHLPTIFNPNASALKFL